jgi:peroxiredoxin
MSDQLPDLALLDEAGKPTLLSSLTKGAPLLLLCFDPDDQKSRELLRNYRDLTLSLRLAGVGIAGVARAEPSTLSYLRMEMGLGFPLFADSDGEQLESIGMNGQFGLLLVDDELNVKQRALGGRAPAESMLSFVKRGGLRSRRGPLTAKLVHAWHSLQHAFKPRRLAR